MYLPTLEACKKLALKGNAVPVCRTLAADTETPVSIFLKAHRGGPGFLLESVQGGDQLTRYSFIGTEPYRVLSAASGQGADPLRLVQDELARVKVVPVPGLPSFCGGAVGYLGYETVRRFERLPSPAGDPLGLPESVFLFTDTVIAFDHVTRQVKIISLVRLDGDIDVAYRQAIRKTDELAARLEQRLPEAKNKRPTAVTPEVAANMTRPQFEAMVGQAKEYITAGEAIQVVLSQRFSRPAHASPFSVYRALRAINPSPYMFYLDLGGFQLVGASPEMLVKVTGDTVTTRPLAGTRRRGQTLEEDQALEQELRHDEKERAEHVMLVDLGRNDIGRVSRAGSVAGSELMSVERYSHVMHLVTNVSGRLRPEFSPADALRACFPAGTVSGAPKVRAMEIIAELEPDKRGPYAGCVGYFDCAGNMDTAITIRTIVMKDGLAHVQAGAGIVYDSVPGREYEETLNKAGALLQAIAAAEREG